MDVNNHYLPQLSERREAVFTSVRVRERAFTDLLDDALSMLWVARMVESTPSNLNHSGFLARNVIVVAAFAVESCANCCLDALHVGGQFSDELERLTTLGKFDVFLLSRGGGKFLDRGRKEVQAISALKRVRDDMVHPKPFVTEYRAVGKDEFEAVRRLYDILGLSRDSREWNAANAEGVLRSLIDFLHYFFINECKLGPNDVRDLLGNVVELDGRPHLMAEWSRQTIETVADLKLDVAFLGFENIHTKADSPSG
jgi:hypothetical protein